MKMKYNFNFEIRNEIEFEICCYWMGNLIFYS